MGNEAVSLEVKWPGRETDSSSPSSAKIKEYVALYLHPNTPSGHGTNLKHRDDYNFTLLLCIWKQLYFCIITTVRFITFTVNKYNMDFSVFPFSK